MSKKKEKFIEVSKLKHYLKELVRREKLLANTINHERKRLSMDSRDNVGTGLLIGSIFNIEKIEGELNEIGKHILIIETMIEAAEAL